MKVSKNKNSRLEIRLDSESRLLLDCVASDVGKNSSEYVRLLIDNAILALKTKIQKGEITYADCKAVLDYQLQYRKFFRK